MAEEEMKKEEVAQAATEEEKTASAEENAEAEVDVLRGKVKELEDTIADLRDKALREAAEVENYKKRLRQEKENAVKYANEALIQIQHPIIFSLIQKTLQIYSAI